ncbi:MAG TPA: mandelate racemase/muconate lactonizing enzyme family protein [Humibacter sp.]|nr:mandelate racemase/muconate lactonizing enzyme family protein [Humibacter sp.]
MNAAEPANDAGLGHGAGPVTYLGRITDLRTRLIDAPLIRPWGTDVTELHLIEVLVDTESGVTGHGFSWTPSIGAYAVRGMLDHDVRDFAVGRPADAVTLWPRLWEHLHEAGSGGVTTIAMAGLDLALWDAAGRAAGASVTDLLGARRASVEVYGSGVNRHYPLDELVAQAQRWRDAGHRLVKMKVGLPELADDVERVAAVRETVGPDVRLAIDANQLWDLSRAEAAVAELERFDLAWLEEPLRADDLSGHARLRAGTDVPIALGENLHTVYRFSEALDLGACDILQPNVVRVGGITPFLEIARLASDRGVPLYPHLLPELSAQLELAAADATAVEDVEDATFERLGILAGPSPIVIADGEVTSRGLPGLGVVFA